MKFESKHAEFVMAIHMNCIERPCRSIAPAHETSCSTKRNSTSIQNSHYIRNQRARHMQVEILDEHLLDCAAASTNGCTPHTCVNELHDVAKIGSGVDFLPSQLLQIVREGAQRDTCAQCLIESIDHGLILDTAVKPWPQFRYNE